MTPEHTRRDKGKNRHCGIQNTTKDNDSLADFRGNLIRIDIIELMFYGITDKNNGHKAGQDTSKDWKPFHDQKWFNIEKICYINNENMEPWKTEIGVWIENVIIKHTSDC
ncbi:MAG: hypothetical protein Q6373_021565 [Candidatus Sigynarchaeota archaeon]